jgi:phage baseplate assembly protein W
MNTNYMAFEFVHPDFGRRPGQVVVPEQSGMRLSAKHTLSLAYHEASVRQAILILLTTRPGERVMRPQYGCMLHTLAFSPNDDTTAGLAIHFVRQALNRWEPRIRIVRLDASRNPETEEVLDIYLEYVVLATNRTEQLIVPVMLSGAEN